MEGSNVDIFEIVSRSLMQLWNIANKNKDNTPTLQKPFRFEGQASENVA